MTDVKVVIGANFGDEGKGLMTDYFCHQATSKNKSCIVVMANGGAQRGHTVTTLDGKHHVFNHFGSGSFVGADTCCPHMFIVNPMQFFKEFKDLEQLNINPTVYVDARVRWTTPFDMIINQIVESARGDKKHGSCGMGIWETTVRYLAQPASAGIFEFTQWCYSAKEEYLKNIRDNYMPQRLKDLGVADIPEEWRPIVYSPLLIYNFIKDVTFFCNHVKLLSKDTLKKYKTAVFENGQGLLLDQNNTFYGDNTTPSNTGVRNSLDLLNMYFDKAKVELCYVTRTYMTRHGVGRFETECNKSSLNSTMFDETNLTNPFQDHLRYGELIVDNLVKRVNNDAVNMNKCKFDFKTSIAVTHTNEYQFDYSRLREDLVTGVYTSDSKFRESVKQFKEF